MSNLRNGIKLVLENIQFTKWPISIVWIAHVTSKLFHVFSSRNIFKKIETWWRDEIICQNSNCSVFLEQIVQGVLLVLAIELVWFDGTFRNNYLLQCLHWNGNWYASQCFWFDQGIACITINVIPWNYPSQ